MNERDASAPVPIALVGDHDPAVAAHRAIPLALRYAGEAAVVAVSPEWVHTGTLAKAGVGSLARFSAIWGVPASPYADAGAAFAAIRLARESGRPFLGTCGGFQHAVLEYARNVLGMADADHAETNPRAERPLIAPLACPLVERAAPIRLRAGSKLRTIYGADAAEEVYHCSYGLSPYHSAQFDRAQGMCVGATDDAGEVRAIELADHPFFIATLFQPERSALRGAAAHPLITAFVAASALRAAAVEWRYAGVSAPTIAGRWP